HIKLFCSIAANPDLNRDVSTSSTTRVNTLNYFVPLLPIPILIGTCLPVPLPGKQLVLYSKKIPTRPG
ncbi:MAG: hypothetical protein ABI691_22705, partial [Ginsengibacter sp.]